MMHSKHLMPELAEYNEESDTPEALQIYEESTTAAEEDNIYRVDEAVAPQHEVMTHLPDRYLQQAPSSTRKVAYVIFGGREPGLWFNWNAIRTHLNTYPVREEPRYKGYTSHDAAQADYDDHLKQQALPPRQPLPPRTPTSHVPPSPGHTTPNRSYVSPLNYRGSPARVSPSPALSPRGTIADGSRASPVPQATRRTVSQAERSATLTPRMLPATVGQSEQNLFFVVLHGYNPGVYNSLIDAQRARGALNSGPGITRNTSQAEANRVFVDAYMTGHVKCWVI